MNPLPGYLNTDLDLPVPRPVATGRGTGKSGPFHASQKQWADGSWSASLETQHHYMEPESPSPPILTAVESIQEPLQNLWASYSLRSFNIGYCCGYQPGTFQQQLTAAPLARLSAVEATVGITIYSVSFLPEAGGGVDYQPNLDGTKDGSTP